VRDMVMDILGTGWIDGRECEVGSVMTQTRRFVAMWELPDMPKRSLVFILAMLGVDRILAEGEYASMLEGCTGHYVFECISKKRNKSFYALCAFFD
jgi:hypothetical protein